MNKLNITSDKFFKDLVNQVIDIVCDINPNGIIRVPKYVITKLEYHSKQIFEEEFLYKVYERVARILKIGFEVIVEKMKGRILPV
ncbi:hypothetical protein [Candidatus Nitrosocosmicus sp. T]